MADIRVGIVDITNGVPDPYSMNDVVWHASENGRKDIEFEWIDMGGNNNRPTHYFVYTPDINLLPLSYERIASIVNEADTIMGDIIHTNVEDDTVRVGNGTIGTVDLVDYEEDGKIRFSLDGFDDTWISAVWRG